MIAYETSITSLLHPELLDTFFQLGAAYNMTQLGVEIAQLAYFSFAPDNLPRVRKVSECIGFTELGTFRGDLDAQAFAVCCAFDSLAIVAFRRTQALSLEDDGVDLAIGLTFWSGTGRVHQGFAASFEAVRPSIEQWMTDYDIKPFQLLLCGHSLGGALATLAASTWKAVHLFTISALRVGDEIFTQTISGISCNRIFNCCDLVARVPPCTAGGFDHFQPCTCITSQCFAITNAEAESVDKERHLARADFFLNYAGFGMVPTRDLTDHAPVNYVRAFFP